MKKRNEVTDALDSFMVPYVRSGEVMAACIDGMFCLFVPCDTETAFADTIGTKGGIVVTYDDAVCKEDILRVITDVQKRSLL